MEVYSKMLIKLGDSESDFRQRLMDEERMCSMLIASTKLHSIRTCMTSYSPSSSKTSTQLNVVNQIGEMIESCCPYIEGAIRSIDCALDLSRIRDQSEINLSSSYEWDLQVESISRIYWDLFSIEFRLNVLSHQTMMN